MNQKKFLSKEEQEILKNLINSSESDKIDINKIREELENQLQKESSRTFDLLDLFDENNELIILEDDAYIIKKEEYDGYPYKMKIEGFIFYSSKDDVIESYTEILDKFRIILEDNNVSIRNEDDSNILYKTYDIEIKKYDSGFMVFLQCPYFENVVSCYHWFEGIIEQINGLSCLD